MAAILISAAFIDAVLFRGETLEGGAYFNVFWRFCHLGSIKN